MRDIWLSTMNAHKKAEFVTLLEPLGFHVHTPAELSDFAEVKETGTTFAANALLKAEALYAVIKQPVIADDSGLMVAALDDAPGVYSARYAGKRATDKENRELLLHNMHGMTNRHATFVCVLALVENETTRQTFEGRVEGRILFEEKGTNGFGYDAIFFSEELGKTFAEATTAERNQVSHRARALQKMLKTLSATT